MAISSSFAVSTPFLRPPTSRTSSAFTSRNFSILPRKSALRVLAVAARDPSKVAPQGDRVLVRLQQLSETSAGGVLLPKSAVQFERYLIGEVLSVGADVGIVEAGKKVLFSDISAYEVDLGTDARHCFCHEGDLMAIIE